MVSLEKQVSSDTPPAFIWHTYDDAAVPVENSLLFALEMKKHNIPLEMHIFPKGVHGLALATKETGYIEESCSNWPEMAARWAENL